MKLASGIAPVATLMARGVNVALGTDGAASNNRLDLFGEMRLAALLAKVSTGDAAALPAPAVLRMATLGGAQALSLDDRIGSLVPGKEADVVAVDMGEIDDGPVYDPVSHLVHVTVARARHRRVGGRRAGAARARPDEGRRRLAGRTLAPVAAQAPIESPTMSVSATVAQRRSCRAREVLRRSRTTGGIPATRCSARCTRSIRCAWAGSRRVAGSLAGKRVVDVGCGGGILAEGLAQRGAEVLGIDLAEKALGVAKLHKLESGAKVDYRLVAAEDLAREMPASFDVVACMEMVEHVPDPASTDRSVRGAGQARRHGDRLDDQPQSEVLPLRHPRRRIRAAPAAQGHARMAALRAARRARGLRAARRARPRRDDRRWSTTRSPGRSASSAATRTSTTSPRSVAMPDGAPRARRRGRAVRPRRHARGHRGRPRRRAQPGARRARAAAGARSTTCAPTPPPARAGCCRRAWASARRTPSIRSCATRSSRTTRSASPRPRGCSTASTRCSMRWTRAGSPGASSPTRRRASPARRRVAGARPSRPDRRVRRHHAAREAAPRAPCTTRRARSASPPARCVYVGDDLRDVLAGNAAGMATLVARWGYMGTGEPHDRWPATGGADDPLALARLAAAARGRPEGPPDRRRAPVPGR